MLHFADDRQGNKGERDFSFGGYIEEHQKSSIQIARSLTRVMNLYRTVSSSEFEDYKLSKQFRVGRNILEGKQFFKTEAGVREFVKDAKKQNYLPAYAHLLIVEVEIKLRKAGTL